MTHPCYFRGSRQRQAWDAAFCQGQAGGWRQVARLLHASLALIAGLALFVSGPEGRAANSPLPRVWQTQTFPLRAGWSAIYSHVDASHASLDDITLNNLDILEIWRWSPEFSSLQFLEAPDQPDASPSNWLVWRRSDPSSTLDKFGGNAAYLVKLKADATQLQWTVKGAPVPTVYNWKSDGMNLIGFSTLPVAPPTFEPFFAPVPRLLLNTPIFQYRGGDLGPTNPLQLITLRDTPVRRGEAFWVRAGDSERYYGRVEVELQDNQGLHFGDRLSRYRLTLRNLAISNVTVQASLVPSESVPLGEEALASGTPTLLVRGDLNPTTLKYAAQTLAAGTPRTWTLAPRDKPGSEVTLILGMHWALLNGAPGALNGAILRITEDAGHLQYDLPVTARVPDLSGLWVGEATVTHVRQDLKSFRKSSDQGTVTAAQAGDITVTWVRRLPEGATPADAADTSKWLDVAGLYFRKVNRTYLAVPDGQALPPPELDENGLALDDPGFYWQARPVDPSFAAGYFFDEDRQVAVGNGYNNHPTLIWLKAPGVVNPANGTYPAQQLHTYENALENQDLPPPALADLDVVPAYWNPAPLDAPAPPPFGYNAGSGVVTALAAGNVAVVWLKAAAEASVPADAGDTAQWFLFGTQYFRKFPVSYSPGAPGTVLDPPTTDETGAALGVGVVYWQSRPYHPSFVVGYAYTSGTGQAVANGALTTVELVWLPVGVTDAELGTVATYTNAPAGTVLGTPARTRVAVGVSHWVARPDGAPSMPVFLFKPSGDTYALTAEGQYIQTTANQDLAKVAKPMPLRLVLHSAPKATAGQYAVSLLQRVYFSTDNSAQLVLANLPGFITEHTTPIQRISTVHVPWTENNLPIACDGSLSVGVTGEMNTSYADPIANPFVHAYHPDHDNLDARFEQPLGQGVESYGLRRTFTLTPSADDPDFDSLARGGDLRLGVYEERLRIEGKNAFFKEYLMRGGYLLRRIIKTPTLLTQ